ncbi:MAG: hypothetical protein ACK4FZ_00520 [Vogesella sp.]|uniref:hypothetical protein n=1 Tax=Vogesella sp. TaxID=1904252 RepID=UPI00391D6D89
MQTKTQPTPALAFNNTAASMKAMPIKLRVHPVSGMGWHVLACACAIVGALGFYLAGLSPLWLQLPVLAISLLTLWQLLASPQRITLLPLSQTLLLHRHGGLPSKRYHLEQLAGLDTRLVYSEIAEPYIELRLLPKRGRPILLHSSPATLPHYLPDGTAEISPALPAWRQLRQHILGTLPLNSSGID